MTRARLAARLAALVAAVLTAAAGLVGLSSAPAAAALCSGGGVNVVVDFNQLGGGVQKGCDPRGANRKASDVFPAAGFGLTYASRQPGFVCRVKGTPKSDPCANAAPADAYWALYWSDGKSGSWSYSSTGVSGLKVPSGGFVAFSWQNSKAKSPPSASPRNSQAAAEPKPAPTKKPQPAPKPTKAPGGGGGGGSGGGGDDGDTKPGKGTATKPGGAKPGATGPSATRGARPTPGRTRSPSPTGGTDEPERNDQTDATDPADDPTDATGSVETLEPSPDETGSGEAAEAVDGRVRTVAEEGGLPVWVPVGVLLGLAAATGGILAVRRRGSPG